MKRILMALLCSVITMQMTAQKIDLNKVNTGQEASVQEPGCVQWDINKIASDTKTLENGVVITIAAAGNATIPANGEKTMAILVTVFLETEP